MIPDAIGRFFEEDGWVVDELDDGAVQFFVRGDSGEWYGQVWWIAETEQLLVYSLVPIPVPEAARRVVAVLANDVNASLSAANFELDRDDGALRCRVAVSVDPASLDVDLVRRAVHLNVATTDRHLPDFVGPIVAVLDPVSAEEFGVAFESVPDGEP